MVVAGVPMWVPGRVAHRQGCNSTGLHSAADRAAARAAASTLSYHLCCWGYRLSFIIIIVVIIILADLNPKLRPGGEVRAR